MSNKRATVNLMVGALSGLGQIEVQRGIGDAALKAFVGVLEVYPHLSGIKELVRKLHDVVRGREL
ncbi:MAG: hypothetical protein OSB67_03520 [Alphaproteobacteria bacterium]|nr:hypothetical protein [Alphaproteobacteria bacterium]